MNVYNSVMGKAPHIRLNITLPEATVVLLESVADKGSRSALIDSAIKKHIGDIKRQRLKERLKAGAIDRAERDREIAEEWAGLEDNLWQD